MNKPLMKDTMSVTTTHRDDHKPLTGEDAIEIIERLYWDIKGVEVGYSVIMNRIIANSETLKDAIEFAEMIHIRLD